MRNSLTEAIVYTTDTVSKRKLSPKEALERRDSIRCVYNIVVNGLRDYLNGLYILNLVYNHRPIMSL